MVITHLSHKSWLLLTPCKKCSTSWGGSWKTPPIVQPKKNPSKDPTLPIAVKSSRIQAPKLMAFGFRLSAFVGDGGRTFTKDQCQTDGIHGRTPYFDLGSSLEDTRFGVSLNTGNPKQKPHLEKQKNTSPKIDTNQPCFLQFWLKTIARVGAFAKFALTYTMCFTPGARRPRCQAHRASASFSRTSARQSRSAMLRRRRGRPKLPAAERNPLSASIWSSR